MELESRQTRAQEKALELSFHQGGPTGDPRAGHVRLGGDDDLSLGLNTAPERSGDSEFTQIDVRSALRARRRLYFGVQLLLGTASETGYVPDSLAREKLRELVKKRRALEAARFFQQEFLNTEMLSAFPAECRLCISRLKLAETTVRAVRADLFRLLGDVAVGHAGPWISVSLPRRPWPAQQAGAHPVSSQSLYWATPRIYR